MTCKIERLRGGGHAVVRVSGRIRAEHVGAIEELIAGEEGRVVLDLGEVTLVDRDAIRWLARCGQRGVELANCPPFVLAWMSQEPR